MFVKWKNSLFLLLLILIVDSKISHSSETISLQLAWKHQFQFAGYYAALHKGFYKRAGLDVVIIEGGNDKFAREEVRSGRSQYGIAGAELILHRMAGDPFVVLAPIFQHSPSILLAKGGRGISNIQELIGKRVMLLPGEKDADILASFLNEGIDLNSIERLDQTYNLDDLTEEKTDAVSAYITNEPWQLEKNGEEPVVISPQTYGVDFYGDCLFTTEDEIAKHPKQVDAFLTASLQGWKYAMLHSEEIIDLLLLDYGVKKSRDHLRYEAQAIREIMLPDLVQVGHMNPGRWHHIAETYAKLGMLDPEFSLDGFIYNPDLKYNYTWLIWAIGIMAGLVLLVGSSTLILFRFNRKLTAEIADRKMAEKQLQDVLLFKEKILSESPVGTAIYEADSGDCIAANQAMADLIGATVDQVLSQKYLEIASWQTSGLLTIMKAADEEDVNKQYFTQVETSYGNKIVIDCHIAPFFYEDRKHLLLTATDNTRRVQNERKIEQQKEKAELYLNLAGIMFIGFDELGNINIANEKACKILECNTEDIIGLNWCDNFISEEYRDDCEALRRQFFAKDNINSIEYNESKVLSRGGKTKLIAWHNAYIKNDDGQIIGVLGSGEDITEKREMAVKLQQAQKMESIGKLAGGIAHDFNNILASILGFSEIALGEVEKGSVMEDNLQEIYAGGLRARDIVKQILAFARQSDEKVKPIRIDKIIYEALKLIRPSTPTTIEIRKQIESSSFILANSTQIHQIMMNLCTNASHAMQDSGGIMTVSLKDVLISDDSETFQGRLEKGKYVKMVVTDNGCGIDSDHINLIFDPYFTTKGVGEGTGMGLAMVQGIVDSYGGIITVESIPFQKTTFSIYLPVTNAIEDPDSYQSPKLPSGTESILAVDDEPPIARMVCRILEGLGYAVTFRTSSLEALELFKAEPARFDLVITDMTMPYMTGDKLAMEIKKIRDDIQIILCTGYSNKISADIAQEIGIDALAYKPLSMTDLANTVRNIFDNA
ncbi:ABC transporter substrate-binding protein [Desulforhopalus vacuolatus]|uniref:ABC transporter substrate-binding protein n=1 Tax=Desulforhopalus vacuolatus TaxID=40414 RepID=UPI0019634F4A|nr:ABC transporter substrate-binding protein [Desulforhopalus vacuolatus]MBM9518509.1 ABC transporter substrate-binding protein [Desulforhopalus vacuolatus]